MKHLVALAVLEATSSRATVKDLPAPVRAVLAAAAEG